MHRSPGIPFPRESLGLHLRAPTISRSLVKDEGEFMQLPGLRLSLLDFSGFTLWKAESFASSSRVWFPRVLMRGITRVTQKQMIFTELNVYASTERLLA